MSGGGRTNVARVALEWALRVVALAALALLLWRRWQPERTGLATVDVASGADVPAALARWTRAAPVALGAHTALDSLPDAAARDWMVALRRAGVRLGWSAERAPAVAVAATAAADPQGGVRLAVAAPPGARVAIGDEYGVLDTLRAAGAGASVTLADAGATLRALGDGARAATRTPAPPRLGRVLVLGRAGWEAKFVVAALEERGWRVSARMPVAPTVVVAQGPTALDTAQVSAVVALDSTAALDAVVRPAAIARFVRDGGGLVLAGDAATMPAFRALAAGAAGARVAPPLDGAAPAGDPFGALAHAVAALGAPSARRSASRAAIVAPSRLPDWIPFTIAVIALLAEWASRRRRGTR